MKEWLTLVTQYAGLIINRTVLFVVAAGTIKMFLR